MLRSTLGAAFGFVFCGAAPSSTAADRFAGQAERAFTDALSEHRRAPADTNAAIALARAAFDWGEYSATDRQRAAIAERGIEAARAALVRNTNLGAAHYWLGMNLGQMARTKSIGAIPLIKEIAAAFLRARDLDPKIDFAGPDRSLGLLYRDAPGWPTSLGNKKKAREHLERAAALCPEFPENPLCLLETCQQWGERQNFTLQLRKIDRALNDARPRLTGPQWEAAWADWNKRLEAMKTTAVQPGRATTTPKGPK